MMTRTVTAFFDTRNQAQAAVTKLIGIGIPTGAIRLLPDQDAAGTAHSGDAASSAGGQVGFWEGLKDLFLPEEDRHVYAEGMSRGGNVVSVSIDDADYDRVADVLDDEGTIDLDERETEWRKGGWKGYTGTDRIATTGMATGSPGVAPTAAIATASATDFTAQRSISDEVPARTVDERAASSTTSAAQLGSAEAIPVAQETLRVGKREVNQGRVRIRSYVVETPVTEQVNLREERVNLERRPVDRALNPGEELFRDRTIELDQRTEEAVISKDVRVTEEILLNKDVTERTQTVSDTVRHTEVEVEDERTGSVTARDSERVMVPDTIKRT